MKRKTIFITLIILSIFVALIGTKLTYAADVKKFPTKSIFEAGESGEYFSGSRIDSFTYGKSSIGTLSLLGDITSESTYNGYVAYAAGENIKIHYMYDGSFQTEKKEDWNLISDKSKKVNGIDVSGKIGLGAVIIQKSTDGSTWKNATDPVTDYFEDNKGLREIGDISSTDIKKGTYYRVILAYKMGRKTGKSGKIIKTDDYEYKLCTEVYEFYVY